MSIVTACNARSGPASSSDSDSGDEKERSIAEQRSLPEGMGGGELTEGVVRNAPRMNE